MSYLDNRAVLRDLLLEGRFADALTLAETAYREEAPYSSDRLYSLVDTYAIRRQLGVLPGNLVRLFDARNIGHARIADLTDIDVDAVNARILTDIERLGLDENPRPHLGIEGKDKLLIGDARALYASEPLASLIPVFQSFLADYLTTLGASDYPRPLIETEYRVRAFVAATRGDGYHPPHLHSNAGFVMVYYVRVPDGAAARLQFGTHNMVTVATFHEVTPREGDLFVFPSCFMHGTTPTGVEAIRANLGLELEPSSLPTSGKVMSWSVAASI